MVTPLPDQRTPGPRAVTLPSGVVLDPDGGAALDLTSRAHTMGFRSARVWFAHGKGGKASYLLWVGQDVVYDLASAEEVVEWIDTVVAAKGLPR